MHESEAYTPGNDTASGHNKYCILDATTLRYLKEVSDDLDDSTLTFGPKERAIRYDSERQASLWLKVIVTFFPEYFGRLQLAHL